jgi:hypothetical protein
MNSLLIAALFFVFIFIFGYWVSRAGKPYNALLFNIHKLIGLAAGIYLIREVYRAHQLAIFTSLQISLLVLTVLIFVILVVVGGLLSAEAEGSLKNVQPVTLRVLTTAHHLLPYLAVVSTAAMLYLLLI